MPVLVSPRKVYNYTYQLYLCTYETQLKNRTGTIVICFVIRLFCSLALTLHQTEMHMNS